MISYYLMFRRDLKLSIKKATLSKEIVLVRVIELIYKVSIIKENVKIVINKA